MVHYLAVTGKKRWYLAVLIGNKEFKWFVLDRDEDEIAALMGAEAYFWELVRKDTPPAVDGTKATAEALGAVYANSNDAVVDLEGFSFDMRKYAALKEQIKELETQAGEIANRVKKFMGEAGRAECAEYKVSWKSQTKRTFDSKRFAKENPDIDLSSYYNMSSTRVFRVTEAKGA
jgi:predicted phage-related endonuclease